MTDWLSRCKIFVLLLACVLPGTALAASRDAQATVVIYNLNDPHSRELAEYYAGKREIPEKQIIGLDAPLQEEISRTEYHQKIAEPLRKTFIENGWWDVPPNSKPDAEITRTSIRYAALIRGMPLKIAPDPELTTPAPDQPPQIGTRNEASLDSDLSILGLGSFNPNGAIPNPYYRSYTNILDSRMPPALLLVCRLDAPTAEQVKQMIDDSIATEKRGLWGWAYIDTRNIFSGGYKEGDDWLRNCANMFRKNGVPVIMDTLPQTLPKGFPVTDAAIYYGWYDSNVSGPFSDPLFRFKPGAIAVHIHSFSAKTLRNPVSNWAAPLIARGAAATAGNVYEPYLSLTLNLDIFQERLMAGFNLAESAYMATKVLSWMAVVIGDPLYRPYAAWRSMDDGDNPDDDVWRDYRRAVLSASSDLQAIKKEVSKLAAAAPDAFHLEALADLEMATKNDLLAQQRLQDVIHIAGTEPAAFRAFLRIVASYQQKNQKEQALALLHDGLTCFKDPSQQLALQAWITRLSPPPPPPPTQSPTPAKK